MLVNCATCLRWYDDAKRLTICPHPRLHEPGWRDIIEKHRLEQERIRIMAQVITPTIGRVVWYWPAGERQPDQQPWDAHVCHINTDGTLNLMAADHQGVPHSRLAVPLIQEGQSPPSPAHYCEWMPFQRGQQARTEAAEAKLTGRQSMQEQPAHAT